MLLSTNACGSEQTLPAVHTGYRLWDTKYMILYWTLPLTSWQARIRQSSRHSPLHSTAAGAMTGCGRGSTAGRKVCHGLVNVRQNIGGQREGMQVNNELISSCYQSSCRPLDCAKYFTLQFTTQLLTHFNNQ